MPRPESIRRAWMETDYRVRLSDGGYASIRCERGLPLPLLALLERPGDPWGYITAWNPAGVRLALATNRVRQRRLLDSLRVAGYRCFPGIGVGSGDWREASLFVPAIGFAELDAMARRFGQLGVLRGVGAGAAELHDMV